MSVARCLYKTSQGRRCKEPMYDGASEQLCKFHDRARRLEFIRRMQQEARSGQVPGLRRA